MSKLCNLFNLGGGLGKSGEDCSNIGTLLHRDDSQLILFVDPDKEGLFIIVEDASTLWPVSVKVARLKEPITLLEQEVVSNELLLLSGSH